MSRHTVLLCVFAVLLQLQPWSAVSAHMVPPKGYSLGFSARITKGTTKFVCNRGRWMKSGSTATLTAPDGSNLGTYGSVINELTKEITYYWTIINTLGDYHESGQLKCGLQGTAVKTATVPTSGMLEYLAIVKVHRGAGSAANVAFVSLGGTKGGAAPRRSLCTGYGSTAGVPITGSFRFYTQDRQPPKVPASLNPSTANFLQVMFLEGKVVYKFSAGRWVYFGIFAHVLDIAGGKNLGKFGTTTKADKFGSRLFFQFKDPNGFWMWGQNCAKPVRMTADGLPWQLMKITTSGGTPSPIGQYKYALMGSTMGGLPPVIAPKTTGTTWSSPFTGLCYLYTE